MFAEISAHIGLVAKKATMKIGRFRSTLTLNVSSTFNSKDWESLKFLQLIIFNSLTQIFCIDRKYLLKRDSQILIE